MNASIVDVLIENIKTDQEFLQEVVVKIEETKSEKQSIVNRLKEQQKDISTLLKYADEKQREKIESLGFDFSESSRGINTVASVALDIIIKAKDNNMLNGDLFESYVKTFKNKNDAVNYTEFNIKCRSLFNTQRLLRKKGTDPKSSRTDIISLNGRVLPKQEPVTKKK
ncbi:hypothetical protein [Polaribacter sp. Hel1_85]|uniref:hypothetical protein n=1 Tax=Polaribacter sp. Hel1_85 TaxID=1250005 RepID=UPI00052D7332|nr:hypothetical protein [Polaribacter sp. Hel1_85]KGL59146.1 hypothetical protein PHEL85_3420 [Polaribacter sp. Hel1_85]